MEPIKSLEQVPAGLNFLFQELADIKSIIATQNAYPQAAPAADNKLYTRKEVADIIGISLTTLDTHVKDGTIEASRIGNLVRFTREAIDNALKKIQPAKKVA